MLCKIDLKIKLINISYKKKYTILIMSYNITKAKKFITRISDVSYQDPKVNKRGGKSVQIQLDGQPLVLQIPLMLNWGVNERVDEQSGRVSYDMSLQFNNDSPAIVSFMEGMRALQEKVIDDSCGSKCKDWHGKSKMSKEVAKALMYPILKHPQIKDAQGNLTGEPDYDRFPSMKLKIPFWEGNYLVELYDMNRQPMYLPKSSVHTTSPVEAIPKASHINGLIQCTGIWFAGGKFGITWKLVQACVRPPRRLIGSGTCHIVDDSDDEDMDNSLSRREDEDSEQKTASQQYKPSFTTSDQDDDDEDADEMEDEEEEEPEPVKKKKKKVVRRKKTSSD